MFAQAPACAKLLRVQKPFWGKLMKSFKNAAATTALLAVLTPLAAQSDVVISNDPTQNMSCNINACAPTQTDAVLNVTDLNNMLATGDVTIFTAFSIKKHRRDAYNIDLDSPLSLSSTSNLTLHPYYAVNVNAPVTIVTTGTLTLNGYIGLANINASIEIQSAGTLDLGEIPTLAPNASVTFDDLNGHLTIGLPYTLVADVPALVADIAAGQGKGNFALIHNYDAANDTFQKAPIPDFKGIFTGLGHTIANLKIKKGFASCEGFVSKNEGTLRDISLQGVNVTSTTQKNIGALVGCNYGNISNASVDGTISGNNSANVGGIVGSNTPSGGISIARAAVIVSGGQAGGVVGENDNSVYEAYATGSVTGNSNSGGLVGANKLYVQESYATSSVNGNSGAAGGLAGFNSAKIVDCYSTGTVNGTGYVGGFVGYDPNESISNGYWDLDTSGVEQGVGFPVNDPSAIGLTTAQLQSRLPSGFDKRYWALDSNINNGFPYLRYLPPQ